MKTNLLRSYKKNRPEAPIYLCCYHKVGTVLLTKVFREICHDFNWKFKSIKGRCDAIPDDADVIVFQHSLLDLDSVNVPYLGAHFIRDPRDVIVSGYLYHKRCKEEWCINTNFNYYSPICYPYVPYSQEHRSEEWKRQYLVSLGNMSYQQNLNQRDEIEGLLFEMENYGSWTIEGMLSWDYKNPHINELKFESLFSNYDGTFKKLFEHFRFNKKQITRALEIAAVEDMNRMTKNEIEGNPHISSSKITKWEKYFKVVHQQAFKEQFGNALAYLGYEDF